MNPGETVESAIWVDGTEPDQLLDRYRTDVMNALLEIASAQNVALTPLRWTEKAPGDDRVPEVPDHIQGPSVRLLVAEADVKALPSTGNFLAELEVRDLALLRRLTREGYQRWWAKTFSDRCRPLTNPQCDTLINDIGVEAAMDSLKRGEMTLFQ